MAAYIAFYAKGTKDIVSLSKVDEAICAHMLKPVHPTEYFYGWFDVLASMLALGKDEEYIRKELPLYHDAVVLTQVFDFLVETYDFSSWMGR